MSNVLVSIIIPTYNRAHLIGETIESIISQTYTKWECIVVDDDSKDYTVELMEFYCEKDSRIVFCNRPKIRPKGANACRNYGFEISKGDYINWFDSDDVMYLNFIMEKMRFIEQRKLNFVVSETEDFKNGEISKIEYTKQLYGITAEDYIKQKINWLTPDFFVKRSVLNGIEFNEYLSSGQEYNFFSQLLVNTVNGGYLNKVLCFRRLHEGSIQAQIDRSSSAWKARVLEVKLRTFKDVCKKASFTAKKSLLNWCIGYSFDLAEFSFFPKSFWKIWIAILKMGKVKNAIYLLLAVSTKFLFNKGYYFLKKASI